MIRLCEGHLPGGPFAFLLALVLAGCGSTPGARVPPVAADPIARPTDVYPALGLHSGPPQFPAVVSFGTLAGPADSTYVLIAMSLPNSALRFRREADGFIAEYSVSAAFLQDSVRLGGVQRREVVRVGAFAETARTDESVLFQAWVALPPGRYDVRLRAADGQGSRSMELADSMEVPAYGPGGGTLAPPIVVYDAVPRTERAALPELIVNPRRTTQYGGAPALLYIEAYDSMQPPVLVRLRDAAGEELWAERVTLQPGAGAGALLSAVVAVPGDALPLGRLAAEVTTLDGESVRSPLVLTISDQWLASNFEEVLQFVRLIASREELDSLASGPSIERRARWDAFWARRDPAPGAPGNEFRDEFFRRIRFAAENYAEAGRPGWQTHRGEVYIVLGPPDYGYERYVSRADTGMQPNAIEWLYESSPVGRMQLLFVDRSGFGRYELSPSSLSAFRSAAERSRAQPAQRS